MEYQIKTLAKILNLDTSCPKDKVARFIAQPTERLLKALNILVCNEYYTDWCYDMDYLIIEIEKDTYSVIISTWKDDEEINDAVALNGCDFETIAILMKLVKEVV